MQNHKLVGLVERVTFHNPENGFCVIKVKVLGKKDLVTIIGSSPSILAGEHVECIGQWVMDKEHGLQFRTDILKSTAPTSLEGIEKYLASGLIKGIGPIYAKKLVESYGKNIFDIIENDPSKLNLVPGIGKSRAETIKTSWQSQKIIRKIIIFLHSHNIGTARATRIYREYGSDAISIVEQDPYRLARDIRGIGFKSADKIAESIGIDKNSILRARAGINHALTSAMDNGNCGLPEDELVNNATKLLEVPIQLIKQALALEINDKNVIVESVNNIIITNIINQTNKNNQISNNPNHINQTCIFLKGLAVQEQQIAETVLKMSRGKLSWKRIDHVKAIDEVSTEIGIDLSESQQEALKWVMCSRFTVITGGPGVGKTTLINSVIKILEKYNVEILLSAPTGRAAKRLSEATSKEATTIHRLLKRNPDQEFNKTSPIKCDLLIIDEVSMLDVPLMHAILKALPEHASLLLVGDIDQLPSVGPGQVLSDIIKSEGVTVVPLTKVFRQNQQSSIIINAHKINHGQMPLLNQKDASVINDFYFLDSDTPEDALTIIVDLVKSRLPNKYKLSPLKDIQILSPMTRGIVGTRNLNTELQKALNPFTYNDNETNAYGSLFRLNDKVMQIVNNYDKDVFNGDIGIITRVDKVSNEITITFDNSENKQVIYDNSELDEIIHAYATTIHKSQGSEYNVVVIPLLMQHYTMLQRNLIYTAITRAKKLVIIVGQKQALQVAVKKQSSSSRYTLLRKRLEELTAWY